MDDESLAPADPFETASGKLGKSRAEFVDEVEAADELREVVRGENLGLLEVLAMIAPVTLGAGAPLLPRRLELRANELGRHGDFACALFAVVRPPAQRAADRYAPAEDG